MPPRGSWLHYVEPYGGGLAVMLANDPQGISEVVNDLDGHLMNFWKVLQDPKAFALFLRKAQATPFSEEEFKKAHRAILLNDMDVNHAHAFFVECRQSLAGRMKDFATLSRTRVRRDMNEQASAWLNAIEGLPRVHARLQRVVLLCRDGLKVIEQQDGPNTLFYIDAPYVHDTRASIETYGKHEMSDKDHVALVAKLIGIQGKAIVSMYRHPIYDVLHETHGWTMTEHKIDNKASGGKTKRVMTECLWTNYKRE